MLNSRMMKLAAGVSAAFMMACAPSHAANIRVAVAPSFFAAGNDIAGAFTAYYLLNHNAAYNVTVVRKSSSLIKDDIVAGGASGPYDIFLAASPEDPLDLFVNNHSLVGTPFGYAVDTLELYSPTIDVTAGLPNPPTTDFVVPDPTTDAVGKMAALVLALGPWHILPNHIPGGHAFTSTTASTALVLLNGGDYPYGFVGRSQICTSAGGVLTYADGYHHSYGPPGVLLPTPLHLTAVSVNRTRDAATETELQDFIAYLKGATSSFGDAPARGTEIIQGYCFKLPEY